MTKDQVLKLLEGRIETMQQLSIECIELIYNAGYNEALNKAYEVASETTHYAHEILKLKK